MPECFATGFLPRRTHTPVSALICILGSVFSVLSYVRTGPALIVVVVAAGIDSFEVEDSFLALVNVLNAFVRGSGSTVLRTMTD